MNVVGSSPWFVENCKKVIGDGGSTKFWEEAWGTLEKSLRELYPRLYRLESHKDCLIKDRIVVRGLELDCKWEWSRELLDREVELVKEIEGYVNSLLIKEEEKDKWVWKGKNTFVYTTKDGYRKIHNQVDELPLKKWVSVI